MKKQIPNAITLCNLLCGCIATIYALQGELPFAAGFVVLGIFLDFFDGMFARILKVESEIGLQLDSLADMITSGLVPGIFMVQLLFMSGVHPTPVNLWNEAHFALDTANFFPVLGLLIVLASAFRLAKFNVDTRQTSSFIGLPTPANALLIISLPLILIYQPSEIAFQLILNPWFLMVLTVFSCYLLNAEIPLFSLKFKTKSFKANSLRYLFLLLSIVLLVSFWFVAIPIVIFLYVVLSVLFKEKK
ncbi:MAG: phosphatidylserine synthase [Bacteroidetes bacterium HGW-Bacteroidetes-2]|jgi:CDP-diacylglycerol--serine O-phosphatidyltransferase|nr:MAG: phosphatidylserine synthase [Bacteroidetes bacterium HGW-Bacteroidetes-2]